MRSIQGRLVRQAYTFPKAEGVLKDRTKRLRQGKLPRPIVISDIEARVVQRALLQCLQPNTNSKLFPHLGLLREINDSNVNFGGTPNGGVPKALKEVLNALKTGHNIYFKSDISAFFTKVPHKYVTDFLIKECKDTVFVEMFSRGLSIQLKNADNLREYLQLFPDNDFGVPQGSALSALAGNIFLQDVDQKMMQIDDIKFVRYIDDVIILANSNEKLQRTKSALSKLLKKKGLALYDPARSPDKAAEGHVRDGFEYLGCRIQRNQLEPAKATKQKLLDKVDKEIEYGKAIINGIRQSRISKRTREQCFAQVIGSIDEIIRGWANSFRFANNRRPFTQLDREISKKALEFQHWFLAQGAANNAQMMRMLGVFQVCDVEYKDIAKYGENFE